MTNEPVNKTAVKVESGGTAYVETINIEAEETPDFFKLYIDEYKSPKFQSIQITESLVNKLKENRLLILGGSLDVNKDILARHIASCLTEKFSLDNQKFVAKEWSRSSDLRGFDVKLQNTKISTIFVLTQVIPKNFLFIDLNRIQAATSANHYVILSTNKSLDDWKLTESARVFWHELKVEDVADCEKLINKLSTEEKIENWYNEKRDKPREQLLALGLSFFCGLSGDQFFAALEEVVEQTWKRRDESLCSLDYCDLDNLTNLFDLNKINDYDIQIQSHYPEQRLILFKAAWNSHRRLILSSLPVLVNIVRKSVVKEYLNLELYSNEEKRQQIRKVISEIISDIGIISLNAILPTLLQLAADQDTNVKLVAATAMARWRESGDKLDKRLFNTLHTWIDEIKSWHITKQLDTFIKGGESSNQNSNLYEAHNCIKVTVALTVAYAALYDSPRQISNDRGLSEELFDLIKKLGNDTHTVVRIAFFYSTLPLILQVHLIQLREWLFDIVKQQNSSSDSERDTVKFVNIGIAKSLASAHEILPEETKNLLKDWTEEAHKIPSLNIDTSKITGRESLLSTVAWTYGAIEFKGSKNSLSPKKALQLLHELLKREKHPFVREAIFEAIIDQISRNLKDIESELRSLIVDAKDNEYDQLIKGITNIYFQQRVKLKGGDYWSLPKKFYNNNYPYRYQIWLNSQRPLTEIEEILYSWLENDNISTQQLAIRSLISFAESFDEDEEKEKQNILTTLDEDDKNDRQEPLINLNKNSTFLKNKNSKSTITFVLSWLTIILKGLQYVTFKNKFYNSFSQEWRYYRRLISGVLPELLKQNSSSESGIRATLKNQASSVKKTLKRRKSPLTGVDLILNNLTSFSNKKIKIIADILKLSVWIYRNLSFLIIGILVTFFFRNPLILLICFIAFVVIVLIRLSRGRIYKGIGFLGTLLYILKMIKK